MTQSPEKNLTPSELNRQVRSLLESHYDFVWISGEISNFAAPSSGHWYFSLKDDRAQVRCAMFKGRNQRLRFRPENGDAVRLRARVSLYEGRGEFQLIGEFMEPAGAGALQAQFEALRDRLAAEGLFDAAVKKPLPARVPHLAVVTSPTGAALQDILKVLQRRSPLTRVTVFGAAVQGNDAVPQLCAAIERANRLAEGGEDITAIILARGGGSLEDLWAFNDERLARVIRASALPVICGVGHEVDVTIADFVADARAPTPSAAAEMISDDAGEVLNRLQQQRSRLQELMGRRLAHLDRDLRHLRQRLRHPGARLREQAQRLDELELRLRDAGKSRLRLAAHRLELRRLQLRGAAPLGRLVATRERQASVRQSLVDLLRGQLNGRRRDLERRETALHGLSPLAVLQRGYAILTTETGQVVSAADMVSEGEPLLARLGRGSLNVAVTGTHLEGGNGAPDEDNA